MNWIYTICYYLIALGKLGLEEWDIAEAYFKKILLLDSCHTGAIIHSSNKDLVEITNGDSKANQFNSNKQLKQDQQA